MYFDALTLAAVADELRQSVLGGRIQRVWLPAAQGIALEIYAHHHRHYLLASAHPQHARVHLVARKPSRGVELPTPLLLLLRKYVQGGRLVGLEYPALERLLLLSIVKDMRPRNHDVAERVEYDTEDANADLAEDPNPRLDPPTEADLLRCELIIEPMERRSNILLVNDANVIMDSVKRVTPAMSQRVVLPQQPYVLPPAQDKRDPRSATAAGITALLAAGTPQTALAKAIVQTYRGVSPQAAREVAQRACGNPQITLGDALAAGETPAATLAACLRALYKPLDTGGWEPSLVRGSPDAPDLPRAYAPYTITHLAGTHPQASISAALEAFYQPREELADHSQRRIALEQRLAEVETRLRHQLQQIERELAQFPDPEQLRWEGEMIYAFLHEIAAGQTTLEIEGRTIQLDSTHTPVAAAQHRFRSYQKIRSGTERLHERRNETALRLAGLEQVQALLGVATERDQIDQLLLEAEEQGYLPPSSGKQQQAIRKRVSRRRPLRVVSSDGFDIFVGRSATQNAEVTFKIGRPDDLWLHVRTIAGAHVIIQHGGRAVPERTVLEAASLAAYFSQARNEQHVDVEIARRKLVRKIAGAPPGLVTYRAERLVRVSPQPPW